MATGALAKRYLLPAPTRVTLMTLGQPMELNERERERADKHGIKVVHEPVATLDVADGRIVALRTQTGEEHRFEVLYSALGLKPRSELAIALGDAFWPTLQFPRRRLRREDCASTSGTV